MIKTIFFGTHNFAVSILEALIKSDDFEILAVVTQPDKPVGRRQELEKSPVKILAEKHGLKVEQPHSLKPTTYHLQPNPYDLNIVCDYGVIIPKDILDAPNYKSINIHPSLLPKYRGASPIQSALINGESKTGVTIMLMDEKMDHGAILAQEEVEIDKEDRYTTLSNKLAKTAQILALEAIVDCVNGKITPKIQDDSQATFCKVFTKEDGEINFNKIAQEIYNQFRGLIIWPGVWMMWCGKRVKILKLAYRQAGVEISNINSKINSGEFFVDNKKLYLACANNTSLEILELQLEGKKKNTATEFINGHKIL